MFLGAKNPKTIVALGFLAPISFSVLLVGCGGRTRPYDLRVISSAMDFAVAQKIILENPCKAVALPKLEHKEMKTIPAEQLQAFLQEAKATGV